MDETRPEPERAPIKREVCTDQVGWRRFGDPWSIEMLLDRIEADDPDVGPPSGYQSPERYLSCEVRRLRMIVDDLLAAADAVPGRRIGTVRDAGGGTVDVFVDRSLDSYPPVGAVVYVGGHPPAPAVPVDGEELPEGVERLSDGTTWLRAGADLPGGWEAKTPLAPEEWVSNVSFGATAPLRWPLCMVQVRPVPAPVPDMVPWHDAVGRQVQEVSGEWDTVTAVLRDADYPHGAVVCAADPIAADTSGTVACLPLPESSGK